MQNRLFSNIRQSCAYVASNARHVKLNYHSVISYSQSLPIDIALQPSMDSENHLCGDPDLTLAYFITLDCINFGSGYFSQLKTDPDKNGYFTIASRLKAEFLSRGNCPAEWLQQMSAAECHRIFAQPIENSIAHELMELFAKALNDLGSLLLNHFSGSFVTLIESAGNSAAVLAENLCQMPFYRDIFSYDGQQVIVLKRAQITASDLSLAFNGSGYGFFTDLAELTIFADNLVPHVLECDGLLVYSSDLKRKIDAGILLASGCEEEIEIRACSIHAVELIRQAFAASGIAVTSQQLDYLLWNRGQAEKYAVRPTHQTRCVFY